MINPIVNIERRSITCRKAKWGANEILLAQCFNFEYDELLGDITIRLEKTAKTALFEFLKVSYRNLCESPVHEDDRKVIFTKIKVIYQDIEKEFMSKFISEVPYASSMLHRPGQKFPYQVHALMEMINRKDNLLSFDMRMGKTLVSSTLTVLDKISVTLVVCPGVTKFTAWHDDLIGWGFDKNTFTVYDSKKKYSKKAFNEKFIVINYELLGKHLEEIKKRNVGHIIFDECHRGKSTNTATAKNMQAVVKAFPNARITLLSGTPIANRVDDMYAYFKLIDHPLGANRAHFLRTYGVMYNSRGGEKVKKAKNHEDLRVKLSNFMIRRTQQECFDIMPKQQIRHVVSKDDFEEQYDRMIEELSLQRNHAALSGHIMAINNLTSLIKVPTAMDIIHEAHEYGKKVVVFCSFTAPLDEMERVLTENNMGFVRIDGSVDMASRRDIIKRFWDDPECNVFLGNMKAAGEGIDLSCASEIIFLNYAFTPKDMEQPAERCTSMANPKINTIHYLVCENSIDEVLYDIIVDKKMDIDAIVDQGKGTSSVSAITGEVFRRLTGNSFEVKKKEDEPIINE